MVFCISTCPFMSCLIYQTHFLYGFHTYLYIEFFTLASEGTERLLFGVTCTIKSETHLHEKLQFSSWNTMTYLYLYFMGEVGKNHPQTKFPRYSSTTGAETNGDLCLHTVSVAHCECCPLIWQKPNYSFDTQQSLWSFIFLLENSCCMDANWEAMSLKSRLLVLYVTIRLINSNLTLIVVCF